MKAKVKYVAPHVRKKKATKAHKVKWAGKTPDKYCNAQLKSGDLCVKPAGWRTDHPGQGRCFHHGGRGSSGATTHGWYSNLEHRAVAETLDGLATIDLNVMDLMPEVQLLRALTIDFVNRYETFVDALMSWYEDPQSNSRPRKVMDLSDASHLVESISRIVQRMHHIQSEGAISLDTFRRVTEHMGVIVARHVKNTVTLNRIEAEWMALALDTKLPPSGREAEVEEPASESDQ